MWMTFCPWDFVESLCCYSYFYFIFVVLKIPFIIHNYYKILPEGVMPVNFGSHVIATGVIQVILSVFQVSSKSVKIVFVWKDKKYPFISQTFQFIILVLDLVLTRTLPHREHSFTDFVLLILPTYNFWTKELKIIYTYKCPETLRLRLM